MDPDGQYRMLIDGRLVGSNAVFPVINPATEEVLASAPDCDAELLNRTVAAARQAFPAWAATPYEDRCEAVRSIGRILRENSDALGRLLTAEQGKPLASSAIEIQGAAMWCDAVASLELPEIVNEDSETRLSITKRVPIGVVGALAPWNFPIMTAVWKFAPALVAGNTVILKPSPFTPLANLQLGALLKDELPPGVLNIVSGQDHLGPLMTEHAGIDKIAFTGSTVTGKRVMKSAAETMKRMTLELGGNDAAIVLPDVDVGTVAEKLFWSGFANNGQLCVATKRMFVHEAIYDDMLEALVALAKTVKVGDGTDPASQLGPVQNDRQYKKVVDLIDDCERNGYRLASGGQPDGSSPGYFVPVTIVDNPPDTSRVVQEEAFGPLLPVLKFRDVDEAIDRANASIYGLAGSVWSADEAQALRIAQRLETGTVWVNESLHLSPGAAFCGHKQSGFGIENGQEGLLEYTLAKTTTVSRSGA